MENRSVASLALRACAAACAATALAVLAHWAIVHPALAPAQTLSAPVFIALLFGTSASGTPPAEAYRQLNLVLIALSTGGAALLALVVLARAQETAATRRLVFALASGALAATYFFFLAIHPAYGVLGAAAAIRHGARFAGYALAFVAAVQLARFFLAYPRLPSAEERAEFHRTLQAGRLARARKRWGSRATSSEDLPPGSRSRRWRAWLEAQQLKAAMRMPFERRGTLAVALLLAAASVLADARPLATDDANRLLLSIAWGFDFMFLYLAGAQAFVGLQFHHRRALEDERSRMDWLYGTLLVAGIFAVAMVPLWWAALILVLPHIESTAPASGLMVLFGPIAVNVELLVLAAVLALALSIFYRGAVDPRLALRRVTVFTLVGVAVAIGFLVAERAVAVRLVAWLQLPTESGAFIAGVLVAVTLAPLRSTAEHGASRLVARVLPLASLMEGPRSVQAVVLCDLSGYTKLSATDERQAMLLAALLQRLSDTVAGENGGRVVKTMGDAAMLAFADAASAARAMAALHERFPPAAAALGLVPLPLHTGAHIGEVVQTHDGDLYGQTVNLAARLQGSAAEGQAVVSQAFAAAAGNATGRFAALGPRRFKNVPEPIECLALAAQAPAG